MIKTLFNVLLLFFFSCVVQSCSVAEGIFKAGMWWAFLLVALVVILLFWLLRSKK